MRVVKLQDGKIKYRLTLHPAGFVRAHKFERDVDMADKDAWASIVASFRALPYDVVVGVDMNQQAMSNHKPALCHVKLHTTSDLLTTIPPDSSVSGFIFNRRCVGLAVYKCDNFEGCKMYATDNDACSLEHIRSKGLAYAPTEQVHIGNITHPGVATYPIYKYVRSLVLREVESQLTGFIEVRV